MSQPAKLRASNPEAAPKVLASPFFIESVALQCPLQGAPALSLVMAVTVTVAVAVAVTVTVTVAAAHRIQFGIGKFNWIIQHSVLREFML